MLFKIAPLYFSIIIGYIAGSLLKTDKDVIARFLFYIITPIVIVSGILKIENHSHLLLLPVIVFCISSFMCFTVYYASSVLFSGNIRNIIAYSSGSTSTGHVGLPIVITLFDSETVGIYILAFMGIIVFESTYGFYVAAKGNFSASYCMKRVFTIPALYAIMLGVLLKTVNFEIPYEFQNFFNNVRGAYIILGAATIGLGLSTVKKLEFDWMCISLTLIVKYCIWPFLMFILLFIDKQYVHFYHSKVHDALFLLSIVPISATTMIVGSVLNYPAEKLSIVIFCSVLVGMIYIPGVIALFSSTGIIDISDIINSRNGQ